jgi:hypothetical protein
VACDGHLVILRSAQSETNENEVAARDIVPVPGARFEETLEAASPDLLREMIKGFAQRMMDADVEVRCNAGYGEVTPERGEQPQRLPAAGVGHPGRDDRAGDPQAAAGLVLPGVPGAPAPRGTGGVRHRAAY